MPKIKKTIVSPTEVVDKIKEVETPVESEAKQLLRKIFAIYKEQNPEVYEIQKKDEQLAKQLSEIN